MQQQMHAQTQQQQQQQQGRVTFTVEQMQQFAMGQRVRPVRGDGFTSRTQLVDASTAAAYASLQNAVVKGNVSVETDLGAKTGCS